MATAKVVHIKKYKHRVLLYTIHDKLAPYYAISNPEKCKDVEEGDIIEYDPLTFNCGWFKRKIDP